MYVPRAFREHRTDVLHAAMRDIGAATIVTQGSGGLVASHLPVEIDPAPAPHGTIRCHFAKPNHFGEALSAGNEALLIFQGPQGYITPSWYPTKQQTGKVVPTWNYVAIHAYGRADTFETPNRLLAHLSALTGHFESRYHLPWKLDDAPADFIDGLCRGITGLEIELTRIEGKWKMSQNRGEHDRRGVINGLQAQGDENSLAIADLVATALDNADQNAT